MTWKTPNTPLQTPQRESDGDIARSLDTEVQNGSRIRFVAVDATIQADESFAVLRVTPTAGETTSSSESYFGKLYDFGDGTDSVRDTLFGAVPPGHYYAVATGGAVTLERWVEHDVGVLP